MSEGIQPTLRDEILYKQLKDNRSMYRGVMVVFALVAVAAVIMGIVTLLFMDAGRALFVLLAFAAGAGVSAYNSFMQYKSYASALEEIGPNPAGVDTCKTYSASTAKVIASSRLSQKELFQQFFAYTLVGVMLIGFGILFFVLLRSDSVDIYTLIGAGMLAGGVVVVFLGIKAFRSWVAVRSLNEAD